MKSLREICLSGQDLTPVDRKGLHYAEGDAEILAGMEESHFWFVTRRQLILDLLSKHLAPESGAAPVPGVESKRAFSGLDIGCGSGFNAVFLSERGFPTFGIDAYDGFARYKQAKRGAGFTVGDIFSIDPQPEFDFVLLLDVIEHLSDDVAFVKQALRFLRPGGILVVTVPAFQSLWSASDDVAEHQRRYTKRSLADLLRRLDTPVKTEAQYYFYGATLPLYLISRMLRKRSTKVSTAETKPSPLVNSVLMGALALEKRLLPLGGLPMGSSLFMCGRKDQ